jgi:ABC-type glycerol-3-phosphate transport system permease component
MLPLAAPGVVAVVVLTFILCAGEYLYALAFISPTAQKIISSGVPTELIRGTWSTGNPCRPPSYWSPYRSRWSSTSS